MPPLNEDDDTFARTLTGIERLRGKVYDEDWREWKRVLLANLKAGKALEDKLGDLITHVNADKAKYARQSAVTALVEKVRVLEDERARRESGQRRFLGWVGKAALLALAALLGRISK